MALIFLALLLIILGQIVLYSHHALYGITPTPTSTKVKNKLLQILPTSIDGKIAELGSGWGNLAFALARHFPDCQVEAYEISPTPYLISKILALFWSYPNLQIHCRDFFKIPLHDFSLVVCYLYPDAMKRLKDKFERELSSGAYVLSHTFAIHGWTPFLVEYTNDLYRTPIYLYMLR